MRARASSVEIYRSSSTANGTHWVSTSDTFEMDNISIGKIEKSLGWIVTR
jgi:hypothetical protein